ncbi:MAG: lipid kinase [Alphaproteobacteria bacterium]|nr:lipid kinase [Alphaproteobacteria bacterium]
MTELRRAACFVNAKARSAEARASEFIAAVEARGISVELHKTGSQEEALRTVRDLPETDAILVGGGDGTLSGMLPALLERPEPLGVLPLGTANDFARALSIPQDPDQAAEIVAKGHVREVDIGLLNDRPFLNVASLGISVEVADLHEDGAKKLLGRFAYPMRWMEAWRRHRPLRLQLTIGDEERRVVCSLLGVGCGRHYGGGLTLDEEARPDDGNLRLYYLAARRTTDWFRLLPSLWRGTLRQHGEAFTATAREIEIRSRKPKKINVDGDIVERTPARVSVMPGRLKVLAPPRADYERPNGFGL